jgi:hypothetical protein
VVELEFSSTGISKEIAPSILREYPSNRLEGTTSGGGGGGRKQKLELTVAAHYFTLS